MKKIIIFILTVLISCTNAPIEKAKVKTASVKKEAVVRQYVHEWFNDNHLWTVVDYKGGYVWVKHDPLFEITDSITELRYKQALSVANVLSNLPLMKKKIETRYGNISYDTSDYNIGDTIVIGSNGSFRRWHPDSTQNIIIGKVVMQDTLRIKLNN